AYPSLTAIHSGDYALTGSNIAGCSDTLYGHLTVHPRPSSGFSISSESGFVPLDVTVHVDDPFPGAVYHWNTDEGGREETEVLIFETYAEPDTRVISMEAVSPQGCVSEPSEPKVLEVFGVEASF